MTIIIQAYLIISDSGEEGTFLVRDSASSTGDYVLSVLGPDEVVHYQIRKHEDDAFFSIGNYLSTFSD